MKGPSVFLAVCLLLCCSTTRGDFSTIINVPPGAAPNSIGSDTQLNLFDLGNIPNDFTAGATDGSSTNVEVNIEGGTVGDHFYAYAGSTVNVSGGNISHRFWPQAGSTANITGGSFGPDFTCAPFSTTNILGGVIEHELHAQSLSTVNVWGGTINFFQAHIRSSANFFGREFFLDGVEMTYLVPGQPFTISDRDVSFSGTLADGTPFDYSLISADPEPQQGPDLDHFSPGAFLTVTLVHPADFDWDGDVDEMDLAKWETSYDNDDLADADGDGDSDGEDFLAWQRQYTGSLNALAVTKPVPEPVSAALLLSAGLCALSRRR